MYYEFSFKACHLATLCGLLSASIQSPHSSSEKKEEKCLQFKAMYKLKKKRKDVAVKQFRELKLIAFGLSSHVC